MLASAGFLDNEYEPRRWDAEAGSDEADHRRPDFTAVHPVTFQRWVFDVTVSWSAVAAGSRAGLAADGGESRKRRSYRLAMRRQQREARVQVPALREWGDVFGSCHKHH